MDKKSSEAAADKANAIRVKVGYPLSPNTEDPRSLANWYNNVKINKDTFLENVLSARWAEHSDKHSDMLTCQSKDRGSAPNVVPAWEASRSRDLENDVPFDSGRLL